MKPFDYRAPLLTFLLIILLTSLSPRCANLSFFLLSLTRRYFVLHYLFLLEFGSTFVFLIPPVSFSPCCFISPLYPSLSSATNENTAYRIISSISGNQGSCTALNELKKLIYDKRQRRRASLDSNHPRAADN